MSTQRVNAGIRARAVIRERMDELGLTGRSIAQRFDPPRSDGWISNLLKGRQGLSLDDLDTVAEAVDLPPSALVKEVGSALEELRPTEARMVRAIRELPPALRDYLVVFAEYLIGVLPSDMPQNAEEQRLWRRIKKLTPADRADIALTVEDILTARRVGPASGTAPAAPGSSGATETAPATRRARQG